MNGSSDDQINQINLHDFSNAALDYVTRPCDIHCDHRPAGRNAVNVGISWLIRGE